VGPTSRRYGFDRRAQFAHIPSLPPGPLVKNLCAFEEKSACRSRQFHDGFAVFNRPDRQALEAIDGRYVEPSCRLEQAWHQSGCRHGSGLWCLAAFARSALATPISAANRLLQGRLATVPYGAGHGRERSLEH